MMEEKTITGAQLKVELQALGLSPAWFAQRLGVVLRTVVRWFDGDVEVPPRAVEELDKLSELALTQMREMATGAANNGHVLHTYRTDDDLDRAFPVSWGRKLTYGALEDFHTQKFPASWHRALTYRVLEHFRAQGVSVTVEYD